MKRVVYLLLVIVITLCSNHAYAQRKDTFNLNLTDTLMKQPLNCESCIVNIIKRTFTKKKSVRRVEIAAPVYVSSLIVTDVADFQNIVFQKRADFFGSSFEDNTDFSRCEFQQDVDFSQSEFRKGGDFNATVFQQKGNFNLSSFGKATFNHAAFQQEALFGGASFHETAGFTKAVFQRQADFHLASFEKPVVFQDARFQQGVSFRGASFKESVNFDSAQFSQKLCLRELVLTDSTVFKFKGAELPDTLDLSNIQEIQNTIDLTTANYTRYRAGKKRILVFVNNSDISKFKLDYRYFQLLFYDPETGLFLTNDEKKATYESLLKNFKTRGQNESYEMLNKEYEEVVKAIGK